MNFREAKQHVLRAGREDPPAQSVFSTSRKRRWSCVSRRLSSAPDNRHGTGIPYDVLGLHDRLHARAAIQVQGAYGRRVGRSYGRGLARGWRNRFRCALEGIVLDILAIEETPWRRAWVGPKLNCIDWEGILIHAVVDFGNVCKAKQVRLQPADLCPPSLEIESDPARLDEFRREHKTQTRRSC